MTRAMAVIGLIGAIALAAIAIAGKADWGSPGSAAYTAYELMNRLTGGALLLMAAAPLALRRGLAARSIDAGRRPLLIVGAAIVVMAIASAAEFIVFTTTPYSGPGSEARNLSWLTFLAAGLVALVATTLAGGAFLRDRRIPRLVALGLVVAPSIGVLAVFANPIVILAVPLLGIVPAVAALVLAPGSLGNQAAGAPELRPPLIEGFRRPLDGGRGRSASRGRPEDADYSE